MDGNLKKELAEVETVIDGVTYKNPHVKCTYCLDSGMKIVRVWVKKLEDDGWSDGGEHDMPKQNLPCFHCRSKEYKVEYNKKKIELNSL